MTEDVPSVVHPEDEDDFKMLEGLVRGAPTKLVTLAQVYRESEKHPLDTHRSLHYLWIEYADYLCQ